MKKFVKNVLMLLGLALFAYIFRADLVLAWKEMRARYFPCEDPIVYSIGLFDQKFGLSEIEFRESIALAEEIWENENSKNLFEYRDGGALEVNLIYDTRQEATDKLEEIDEVLDSERANYNSLKEDYDLLKKNYQADKSAFEARVKAFEVRKVQYEKDVDYWNTKGGAPKEEYEKLDKEKTWVNEEVAKLNVIQNQLNTDIRDVNQLARDLNSLAGELNLNVSKFNEIGGMHGDEFEEGVYQRDQQGERINIYQFENKDKLVRLLAHELGHALGLDHVEDEKAIMYRLNNGINKELTDTDRLALANKCEKK
jgi:hypothetical protein